MVVPLADARTGCGAKAASLGRLLRAGFAVPDGFVVDGGEQGLAVALRGLGPGPYAVRSSAVGEDGPEASFAGQLHTVLNVATPAQVAEAVWRVAASAEGEGVAAYAARTGRPARPSVAVIVQVMVDAEVAGVAFTRHPVTGADQVVIEASAGLGDRLVDGEVTPERWMVGGEAATGEDGVLTVRQAREIAEIARRIEDLFGRPQDVEWAIADGTVWVLQARPITTAPAAGGAARRVRGGDEPVRSAAGWPPTAGTAIDPAPVRPTRTPDEQPRRACGQPPTPTDPSTTSGPLRPSRAPDEQPRPAGPVLVAGTAASPGIASGPVRVVAGLDGFGRFADGDVLVCRTTSPAWTPLLARAAAVVTETGGLLAHAAIVAREFAVPAVVAADRAMTVLADGRHVVVDGTHGTVTEEAAR